METVTDFIFGGAPKSLQMVTAAMKLRHLLLGRKAVTNLDRILKNRLYFADKGLSNQSYGFSSSCVRNWTIKKAEHRRIDTFVLWCWRRLLIVPWTASRSN